MLLHVLHTVVSYFCFQSNEIKDSMSYKHVLVIVQCLNTHRFTLYRIIFDAFLMEKCCSTQLRDTHGWGDLILTLGQKAALEPTHPRSRTHSPAGTLCDNGLWALRHALGMALWTVALCCTDTNTPGTSTPPHNWNRRKGAQHHYNKHYYSYFTVKWTMVYNRTQCAEHDVLILLLLFNLFWSSCI